MIFQELNDAPALTVAENIFLGQWPTSGGKIAWKDMKAKAKEVLDRLEVDIPLDAEAGSLRVGERQLLEIARALIQNAKILVLDEPSAALSNIEVERLFKVMDQLKAQGVISAREVKRLEAGLGRGASAQGTRSNQRTRHERTPCWLGHAHASYK